MSNQITTAQKLYLLILISLSAFIVVHDLRYQQHGTAFLDIRMRGHQHIVAQTVASPYRYRIGVAYTLEVFIQALAAPLKGYPNAFLVVYTIYFFFVISLLLCLLLVYLTLWLPDEVAFMGCLYAAATLSVGFRLFFPYTFADVALFIIALYCIYEQRELTLLGVILAASLVSEKAIFIVMAYFIIAWPKLSVKYSPLYLGGYLLIFFALREWLGWVQSDLTVWQIFEGNTAPGPLLEAILNITTFWGILPLLALINFKQAAPFLQRAVFATLPHLVAIAIFGNWNETRLYMFLYPVILPLALQSLVTKSKTNNLI